MTSSRFADARSLLFVPGHRPDRFERARDSGAGCIILDLEDAVGETHKDEARGHVQRWLSSGGAAVVRVNAVGTPWHDDDLRAISLAAPSTSVMLPKATLTAVESVRRLLPGIDQILALVETAEGVLDAAAVARSSSVGRLAFGNVDLGTELGVDPDDRLAMQFARSSLVLASAAAGIAPPVDGVTTAVDNDIALIDDTHAARAAGFTGKLCIHPRQIPSVQRGFAPTEAEIDYAERVLAASRGHVTMLDGKMIDRPVVERARRVLDIAGRDGLG